MFKKKNLEDWEGSFMIEDMLNIHRDRHRHTSTSQFRKRPEAPAAGLTVRVVFGSQSFLGYLWSQRMPHPR
jgi:hypothetical protein